MTGESHFTTPEAIQDSLVQQAIAGELAVLQNIDLSIPAQRQVADKVRAEKFGLPPLSELGKSTTELTGRINRQKTDIRLLSGTHFLPPRQHDEQKWWPE